MFPFKEIRDTPPIQGDDASYAIPESFLGIYNRWDGDVLTSETVDPDLKSDVLEISDELQAKCVQKGWQLEAILCRAHSVNRRLRFVYSHPDYTDLTKIPNRDILWHYLEQFINEPYLYYVREYSNIIQRYRQYFALRYHQLESVQDFKDHPFFSSPFVYLNQVSCLKETPRQRIVRHLLRRDRPASDILRDRMIEFPNEEVFMQTGVGCIEFSFFK